MTEEGQGIGDSEGGSVTERVFLTADPFMKGDI